MAIINRDKFNKLYTEPHNQFDVFSSQRKPNHGKLEPIYRLKHGLQLHWSRCSLHVLYISLK